MNERLKIIGNENVGAKDSQGLSVPVDESLPSIHIDQPIDDSLLNGSVSKFGFDKPLEDFPTGKNEEDVVLDLDSTNEQLRSLETEHKDLLQKFDNELLKEVRLQEKIKELGEIFSMTSHDIKGSISNGVFALESLLARIEDKSLSREELADLLKRAYDEDRKALIMIDNLLTWGRIQREKGINPKIDILNLNSQVKSSIDVLISSAERKGINLENKTMDDVKVLADPDMLQMIIRNLVSNAIKFTNKDGHIIISCENKNNNIEICVADDGVGMPNDLKEKIFTNVVASSIGTDKEKGTGLGLYICKEIVEKMNGSITVESELGKGTKFIVTLLSGEKS